MIVLRESCPPRRPAARLRHRVRPRRARRRASRLRRSSRSALSPAPRPRLRPGAVALRSRLVGRLCRAAVLSARARVAGLAPPSDFVGRPGRGDGVPGASLAGLAPSWPHHLRSALPPPRQWLAGPTRRFHRHDAVGGIAKRRRRGAALGSRGRASRLELAARPRSLSRPLGRRQLAASPPRPSAPGRGDPAPSSPCAGGDPSSRHGCLARRRWAPGSRAPGRSRGGAGPGFGNALAPPAPCASQDGAAPGLGRRVGALASPRPRPSAPRLALRARMACRVEECGPGLARDRWGGVGGGAAPAPR